MLAFALELDALEDMLLFAMDLSWHWDLEGLHLSLQRYRALIHHLFGTQGFVEHETTEPGIILLVRVGKSVDRYTADRFHKRLGAPRVSGGSRFFPFSGAFAIPGWVNNQHG